MEATALDKRPAVRTARRWLVLVVLLAASVVLVLVSALIDQETVADKQDQRSLDLGMPLAWVHQDQWGYDPPFPAGASFASPLENPTSVSWAAFAGDVAILLGVLAAIWLLGATLLSRARTSAGSA